MVSEYKHVGIRHCVFCMPIPPTRLLSVSAHEPQTFSANLRQPKNSNKQQTFEKRMTKTEEFHIISVKIFFWGFICQKRIIFCMMSVCPM